MSFVGSMLLPCQKIATSVLVGLKKPSFCCRPMLRPSTSSFSREKTSATAAEKIEAKPFSEIPEPKGLPLIGSILDYTKLKGFDITRIYEFVKKRHEMLGPIYKESARVGLAPVIVSTINPEDTEAIFRSTEKYPNRPGMDAVIIGRHDNNLHEGVANVQGEEWYQMRRIFNEHLLTNKNIWKYTPLHLDVANDVARYMMENLNENYEIDEFDDVLCKWALESVMVFTLNTRLGALRNEISDDAKAIIACSLAMFKVLGKMTMGIPLWKVFNTADRKALRKIQKTQHESVKRFIKSRSNVGSSVLEEAIAASDLNEQQKDVILLDILAAGIDTTTNATAFILYCLATSPDKQENLRQEINAVLNSGEKITGKTVQRMRYLHACHEEAQRIFPLAQGTIRIISKDMILSGYHVPAGTAVMFGSNVVNNMDEKYFEDAQSFKPERWLNAKEKPVRFALSGSFGFGPRKCPGRRFALQEISCLLIALLSRFKIEYHYEPFENTFNLVSKPSQKSRFTFLPL